MIVQAKRIEAFLAKPDPAVSTFLVHGADRGIVVERIEALMHTLVADPTDPFLVAYLDAERIAADPRLLVEEAQAMSFVGGRRVVRVRDADDRIKGAVRELLKLPAQESYVLIEAGELSGSSDLRRQVEKAPKAASLATYRDEGRGLDEVIRAELARHGLNADREALHELAAQLGADRAVTVAEIDKLALYLADRPGTTVRAADVRAIAADGSALGIDDLVMDVLTGDVKGLAQSWERLQGEGANEVQLVARLSGAFARLIQLRAELDAGQDLERVVEPLFWKLRESWKRALGRWTTRAAKRATLELFALDLRLKDEGGPPRRALFERVIFVLCDPRLRGTGHG